MHFFLYKNENIMVVFVSIMFLNYLRFYLLIVPYLKYHANHLIVINATNFRHPLSHYYRNNK